jgi:hypothetical protein
MKSVLVHIPDTKPLKCDFPFKGKLDLWDHHAVCLSMCLTVHLWSLSLSPLITFELIDIVYEIQRKVMPLKVTSMAYILIPQLQPFQIDPRLLT